MVDITIKVLEFFKKLFQENHELRQKKNAEINKLLNTLGEACRETEMAIKKLRKGDQSDLGALQTSIANKWIYASTLLREEDKELAVAAYQKGASWTSADEWSQEDFQKAIDNIKMIDTFVQEALMNW